MGVIREMVDSGEDTELYNVKCEMRKLTEFRWRSVLVGLGLTFFASRFVK